MALEELCTLFEDTVQEEHRVTVRFRVRVRRLYNHSVQVELRVRVRIILELVSGVRVLGLKLHFTEQIILM